MDYYERLAHYFHNKLEKNSDAYRWLRKRGINDNSIDRFQLGVVLDAENGLQRFNRSISIPYVRPALDNEKSPIVAGLRFRHFVPDRTEQKYDALRGTKAHLYNVEATDAKDIYLCEGEFDAIILNQLGFRAVGVPGAQMFNPAWKYLFAGADTVTLVFDGDEAGNKGSQRIASILGECCPVVRRALLPAGFDVTDMYIKQPRALIGSLT